MSPNNSDKICLLSLLFFYGLYKCFASVRFACAEFHLHFRNNIHCEDDLLGLVTVEKFQYLARILSLMKYEKYDISLSNHRRTHFVKKNKEQDTVVHKNNVCTNFISSYDFVPTVKLK